MSVLEFLSVSYCACIAQHLFNKHSLHSSEALYTPLGIKDTAVTEKRGLYPHGAHNPVDIDQKDAGGTGN